MMAGSSRVRRSSSLTVEWCRPSRWAISPPLPTSKERELTLYRYWSSNCSQCAIKDKCTPGKERRVSRWEHEAILEDMQNRLDRAPDSMRIRRQTVEHPYGTIKQWMGSTHFLTKTLDRVSTEMGLHVLAYNMKRMMKILGNKELIEAIRA